MPNKTFYVPEKEVPRYERVKSKVESAGGTLSGLFMDAMKDYEEASDAEAAGVSEVILFDGDEDCETGESSGESVRFYGRLIGTGTVYDPGETTQSLYKTKKGKYLLHMSWQELQFWRSRVRIIHNNEELKKENLAAEIKNSLAKDRGAVRFLDI